jgi:hypothetical protein
MDDETNRGRPKPYSMTEEMSRESMPPLFSRLPCPTEGIVSLKVETIASRQVVFWKWLPRQGNEPNKRAEG